MKTIKEFKEQLKSKAIEIRNLKSQRKISPYGYVEGLDSLRYAFRKEHIAYCLFRGTPAEKIEKDISFIKSHEYELNMIMKYIIPRSTLEAENVG